MGCAGFINGGQYSTTPLLLLVPTNTTLLYTIINCKSKLYNFNKTM